MKQLSKDIDNILSIETKREILKELNDEKLISLFKKNKVEYKPAKQTKSPLDQQISISISEEEREILQDALNSIAEVGPKISMSAYVRNKGTSEIDIQEWYAKALEGIEELQKEKYNDSLLIAKRKNLLKSLELTKEEDEEVIVIRRQIEAIDEQMKNNKRVSKSRKYRLTGRVTTNEVNTIRWRAARLSLTVSDYMRFLLFDYMPFSGEDGHLSTDSRKKFYISIIDVARNGWGEPPQVEDCHDCARYKEEISKLNEVIRNLRSK